jgi:predicted Fe-Mo cluster-binding NifX family protein
MKIAIPTAQGKLAMHFGHCETFTFIDVEETSKTIKKVQTIDAPPHQPGLLPPWLKEQGASVVIAGGMGQRALALFAEQGIEVIIGAPTDEVEKIVTDFLAGRLTTGKNVCDH